MVEGGSHHELEFYSKLQAPTGALPCVMKGSQSRKGRTRLRDLQHRPWRPVGQGRREGQAATNAGMLEPSFLPSGLPEWLCLTRCPSRLRRSHLRSRPTSPALQVARNPPAPRQSWLWRLQPRAFLLLPSACVCDLERGSLLWTRRPLSR